MTLTVTLNVLTAPTAPARVSRPARGLWASALVEPVKDWVARTIGLTEVFPGKDGWYL